MQITQLQVIVNSKMDELKLQKDEIPSFANLVDRKDPLAEVNRRYQQHESEYKKTADILTGLQTTLSNRESIKRTNTTFVTTRINTMKQLENELFEVMQKVTQ